MDPTRPRRKYTVTEKVRAALRANLAKANAVPRAVRYRSTPRRLHACRQNLEKAHAARRQKGGGNLRRGLYCASLERSLRQAGERREDFESYGERFRQIFPAPAGPAQRAVEGWAQAVWRRMRALRGEGRWEARLFGRWLERMEGAAAHHSLPSAAVAFTGLFEVFRSRQTLERDLAKLSRRLQRLADLALWLGWRIDSRQEPKLEWILRDADVLGNPFYSPQRVNEILRAKPLRVSPVEQWQAWTLRKAEGRNGADEGAAGGGSQMPAAEETRSAGVSHTGEPNTESSNGVGGGAASGCALPTANGSLDFASFALRFEALLVRLTANTNPDAESRRELAAAVWRRLKLFEEFAAAESKRLEDLMAMAEAPDLSRREVRDRARKLLEIMDTELGVLDIAAEAEQKILAALRQCLPEGESLEMEIPEPGEMGAEMIKFKEDAMEFDDEDLDLNGEEDDEDEEDEGDEDDDEDDDEDGDDDEDEDYGMEANSEFASG